MEKWDKSFLHLNKSLKTEIFCMYFYRMTQLPFAARKCGNISRLAKIQNFAAAVSNVFFLSL
jgi:hypothetical protein